MTTRAHVRRPNLPWRASRLTECGRPITDVATWIERDELLTRLRRDGQRRTAFDVCMTCLTTSNQWKTWDDDPMSALGREFFGQADPRLGDELRVLALLVDAHREEFDEAMAGLRQTDNLAAARQRRRTTA